MMLKYSMVGVAILGCLTSAFARAEVATQKIEYKLGDAVMEGYLAYDKSVAGPRPAVLVVPDWMGLRALFEQEAEKLAGMGYVVFVADVYGKGVRPSTPEEAGKQAGAYKKDRPTFRARLNAALDVLKQQSQTDAKKIAAIGYCFGGTGVLELARSGADISGVVTFHGGLDSPAPADGKNIKCKVLVLHGADDPTMTPEAILAFQKEMRDANVDWRMMYYGGAVHSFTNPEANQAASKYNEKADKRSWEDMKIFFGEIFK